jgi:NAD(P)H-quinone oxidoreductase subunit 5
MEPIYQYAWLIPVLPLAGAAMLGTGLISFNKTANQLRRISATAIVSLIGVAMVLSFALLFSQLVDIPP